MDGFSVTNDIRDPVLEAILRDSQSMIPALNALEKKVAGLLRRADGDIIDKYIRNGWKCLDQKRRYGESPRPQRVHKSTGVYRLSQLIHEHLHRWCAFVGLLPET